MGEIRPKKCEGRGLTKDQLAGKGARGMDWDGGCWWALTDGASALEPGKAMLVGTGIEDFFNSGFAFGFFGKTFHNDLSGLSHVHGSTGHGLVNPRPDWFSAYRYFVRRPPSHSRSHPFSLPRRSPPFAACFLCFAFGDLDLLTRGLRRRIRTR